MKKLLSVFLAVIMIFSCCTLAVNALYLENSVETTYVDNLKPKESLSNVKGITYEGIIGENGLFTEEEFRGRYNNKQAISELSGNDFIDALSYVKTKSEDKTETVALKDKNGVETGKYVTYKSTTVTKTQLEILGMPLSFMYGDPTSTFFWKNLTAYPEYQEKKYDENKNLIPNIEISKADISLLFGDVNMFLLRIMKDLYSDYRFYTDENAVKCINFLGKLFYPNFSEYVKGSKIFSQRDYVYTSSSGVPYADEEVFFQKVSDLSGFSDLIQANWIDYGAVRSKYEPVLSLVGVASGELLESEYMRGDKMGPKMLCAAFTKIMGEGPVAYFLNIFESLTKAYLPYYHTPIKLLFSQKENLISQEELKTLTGLLNLIFNDNDLPDKDTDKDTDTDTDKDTDKDSDKDSVKYFFAPLPEEKLAMTNDKSEFYLIILAYLNLNTQYLSNKSVINNLEIDILNSKISDEKVVDENGKVTAGYKTRLLKIFNAVTDDHLEKIFYDGSLDSLTIENLAGKPDEFLGNIGEAISRMIKKIADWFQMWIDIFTGKLEFGAGALY